LVADWVFVRFTRRFQLSALYVDHDAELWASQ